VTGDGEDHQPVVLFHPGYRNLPQGAVLAPLVVTDARGRFALSQACLPPGFTFDGFDELGTPIAARTITRTVRVWVCDGESGALACYPAVTVDPDTGAEVRLTVGN
jgi:hypothetical protein